MNKGVAVTLGSLFAGTLVAISQTINPLNPNSAEPPVPTALQNPTLRPLVPSSISSGNNAGVQQIGVDPSTTSLNDQNTSTIADDGSAPTDAVTDSVSDGKGLAEKEGNLWRIRPIFSVGAVYDDNIFITEDDRVGDMIFTLTAGLAFEMGDFRNLQDNYLIAQYAATGFLYVDHPKQDAVNQDASLRAMYRFSKLAIQLSSSYQYLTGSQREVGNFVTRNLFKNNLTFVYDYSDKTILDLELRQRANVYETYINSYDYSAKFGGEYAVTPKLWLGADFVAGATLTDDSDDQFYQQLRARIRYNLTGKVAVKSSVGVEMRELADGIRFNPVFRLGVEYQPFANTVISLAGYGDVQSSASEVNKSYLATGFELAVRQKLLQKLTVGISVGYENDNYFSSSTGDYGGRVDNYFYLRPTVSYEFLKYLNGSVFYEYRNNDSTQAGNSFYNNRVGVELTAQF